MCVTVVYDETGIMDVDDIIFISVRSHTDRCGTHAQEEVVRKITFHGTEIFFFSFFLIFISWPHMLHD